MAKEGQTFEQWLDEAKIPQTKRSLQQLAVLQATFVFLQQAGRDYASRRIVAHFLLHVAVLNDPPASGLPVPCPADDFFLETLNTPASSYCSPKCSAGGTLPSNVSPMITARSSEVF